MPTSLPFDYRPADPQLEWRDEVPYSTRFGDHYFSAEDGLAETRHVFLEGNDLANRWLAATKSPAPLRFTIAETGFGTGLNFLASWQLWQQYARAGDRLSYIATEAYPLSAADVRRALARWPELMPLCEQLLRDWPPHVKGQHRLHLDGGSVTLDLLYGDTIDMLHGLLDHDGEILDGGNRCGVDAWFLDGFAPAKNPQQWQSALCHLAGRLSARNATCASFTAAGQVRRDLGAAGFEVERVAGFGRKRHMTCGRLQRAPATVAAHLPWHQPPSLRAAKQALVIGAGFAGCSTAAALASRGLQVTIVDSAPAPAQGGASATPAALLYSRLSPTPGTMNLFTLGSFLYALRHYHGRVGFQRSGILQLMHTEKLRQHHAQLAAQFDGVDWLQCLDATAASALAGVTIEHPALHFPQAGYIDTAALCADYLEHRGIEYRGATTAVRLDREGDRWQTTMQDGATLATDVVVIANAGAAAHFAQTSWLPLRPMRGQITELEAGALPAFKLPICHEGYLVPGAGSWFAGASFVPNSNRTGIDAHEHESNLMRLQQALPIVGTLSTAAIRGGYAGVRYASPDYLPQVGAVADAVAFAATYAALRHDASRAIPIAGPYFDGLYVNVGHGSRGLSSAPVSAELIAALVCGETRPLPRTLCEALAPARFLIRALKRNQAI